MVDKSIVICWCYNIRGALVTPLVALVTILDAGGTEATDSWLVLNCWQGARTCLSLLFDRLRLPQLQQCKAVSQPLLTIFFKACFLAILD